MPVPARRKSRSSVRRRWSHIHVDPVKTGVCENCKAPVKSHFACPSCGSYKGRQAVDQSRETKRVLKKMQTRDQHEHAEGESAE